jgi:hypothetical protein
MSFTRNFYNFFIDSQVAAQKPIWFDHPYIRPNSILGATSLQGIFKQEIFLARNFFFRLGAPDF